MLGCFLESLTPQIEVFEHEALSRKKERNKFFRLQRPQFDGIGPR